MQSKYVFGITGGSGTGKSTVSDIFRSMGCEVIDCDVVAREVTRPGSVCLNELVSEFGNEIIDKDGILLRKKLGEIVFSNAAKLSKLNKITHKHILSEIYHKIDESSAEFIGIDGAVLFESGVTDRCNLVIGVLANKDLRISRIMERDNLTVKIAEDRINSQKSDNFYLEKCSVILYNDGNKQQLENKVKEVMEKLKDIKKENEAL